LDDDSANSGHTGLGYDPLFLGHDAAVPMPGFGPLGDKVLKVSGDDPELRYTHFSIVMHRARKLAIVAACNVDGGQLRRVPRRGGWLIDDRIARDQQHGNELYRNNFLDRGHLVRRLSPVWGDQETAAQANDDTFHYTNAFPQHRDLNQQFWLGLEDYLLDIADANDAKVSIFTGPVFDAADPRHRGVMIPRQFWKIVAFRGASDGSLRASAYLLGQEHLIRDMPTEVVFGAHKTYQVTVDLLARLTALDFGPLIAADVLAGLETAAFRDINRYSEIVF
jgi:endonuclease G